MAFEMMAEAQISVGGPVGIKCFYLSHSSVNESHIFDKAEEKHYYLRCISRTYNTPQWSITLCPKLERNWVGLTATE